jgi:phage repressor protein C with HTH and peptisase S24 domain
LNYYRTNIQKNLYLCQEKVINIVMENNKPAKIKTIRPETLEFIILYNQLRGKAFNGNAELAEALGFNSPSSITEIIKSRQNIDTEKLRIFKDKYSAFIDGSAQSATAPVQSKPYLGIPMYEVMATASGVEVYNDINDAQPVGHMYFPGIEDCDFALPVWGHSMYPYLENGCWVALKIIHDKKILPGEVYYIEWGDYRMYKRLLVTEKEDELIAHSDNTDEIISGKPKYAPFTIKKSEIKKLCLVKDIHKKHNH